MLALATLTLPRQSCGGRMGGQSKSTHGRHLRYALFRGMSIQFADMLRPMVSGCHEIAPGIANTSSGYASSGRSYRPDASPAAEERPMIRHFDHVTIVVEDVADAKRFFALLGFEEAISVV